MAKIPGQSKQTEKKKDSSIGSEDPSVAVEKNIHLEEVEKNPEENAGHSPPNTAQAQHLQRDHPNPNRLRLGPGTNLEEGRIVSPQALQRIGQMKEGTHNSYARQCAVNITALPERIQSKTGGWLIGISIKTERRVLSFKYPVSAQTSPNIALVNALESAILRIPPMSDVMIITREKTLWDIENYTTETRRYLRENGIQFRTTNPLPNDVASVMSQLAAENILAPDLNVDAYIFSASITDGMRSFVACIVWMDGMAHYFNRTLEEQSLIIAEMQAISWAVEILPENSKFAIRTHNGELYKFFLNLDGGGRKINVNTEEREIISKTLKRIQAKRLRTLECKFNDRLAKMVRQMVTYQYVSQRPSTMVNGEEEYKKIRK